MTCTFVNHAALASCEMCGQQRQSSQAVSSSVAVDDDGEIDLTRNSKPEARKTKSKSIKSKARQSNAARVKVKKEGQTSSSSSRQPLPPINDGSSNADYVDRSDAAMVSFLASHLRRHGLQGQTVGSIKGESMHRI
jgi:polygalacturonase